MRTLAPAVVLGVAAILTGGCGDDAASSAGATPRERHTAGLTVDECGWADDFDRSGRTYVAGSGTFTNTTGDLLTVWHLIAVWPNDYGSETTDTLYSGIDLDPGETTAWAFETDPTCCGGGAGEHGG